MSTKNLQIMHGLIGSIKQRQQHDMIVSIDRTLTASGTLHKLDKHTAAHIKIHEWHHYKYGMKMLLKYVYFMLKGCTQKMQQK